VQNRLVFSLRCTILYHILWHEYVNLNLKNVCLNLRIAGGCYLWNYALAWFGMASKFEPLFG
jgi:hypothetical protein